MSNKKHISKKEILKLINQGIENGESKTEIHNRLSSEYYDSDLIAKLTASFPDPNLKSKYNGINNVLFCLLILTAILKVISVLPLIKENAAFGLIIVLFVPILNIIFALEVKKNRGYIYRIIGVLAIAGILKSIGQINESGLWALIDLGLMGSISGISFFIGSKMFPNYGLMGPKKDDTGEWKL